MEDLAKTLKKLASKDIDLTAVADVLEKHACESKPRGLGLAVIFYLQMQLEVLVVRILELITMKTLFNSTRRYKYNPKQALVLKGKAEIRRAVSIFRLVCI